MSKELVAQFRLAFESPRVTTYLYAELRNAGFEEYCVKAYLDVWSSQGNSKFLSHIASKALREGFRLVPTDLDQKGEHIQAIFSSNDFQHVLENALRRQKIDGSLASALLQVIAAPKFAASVHSKYLR